MYVTSATKTAKGRDIVARLKGNIIYSFSCNNNLDKN